MWKKRVRSLACEQFEVRRVMASELHLGHNFRFPEDTDQSGVVSPMDALKVINALNLKQSEPESMVDVNADGYLTALDALFVLNRLNLPSMEGELATSGVPSASRILRIEAAIAAKELPDDMTMAEASQILETLRLGGSPEAGDCLTPDSQTLEQRLGALSERLLAFGVEEALVERAVSEVEDKMQDGDLDFSEVVSEVLENHGIDLDKLKEDYREQQKIDRITSRLAEIGVEQSVIDEVEQELRSAWEEGEPFTLSELKERLKEMGVDVDQLFPSHHARHRGGNEIVESEQVEDRLSAMGVDASVIATILAEIAAAEESGSPMTRSQLFERLRELGVSLPQTLTSHRHRPRT